MQSLQSLILLLAKSRVFVFFRFTPPGGAGTFQFSASNGEKATISGNVECIITSITSLFQNQGQCIDFANHNPGNTLGVTKQACMEAFQNKFIQ